VVVNYKPTFHKTKVDKYADSVVEQFLVGEELSAKFDLAEFTIANLLAAMNQGTAQADDAVSSGFLRRQARKRKCWTVGTTPTELTSK
jgi:hypothetical protein